MAVGTILSVRNKGTALDEDGDARGPEDIWELEPAPVMTGGLTGGNSRR